MAFVYCPFCGHIVNATESLTKRDFPVEGRCEVGCDRCGCNFEAEFSLGWYAEAVVPEMLKDCEDCECWNGDYCVGDVDPAYEAKPGCPLGW